MPPIDNEKQRRRAHERRRALMSGDRAEVNGNTTVTGRRIREGRKLWVQLAAWPWWAVVDACGSLAGGMPARWWEMPRVVETYRTWRLLRPDGSIA